MELKPYVVTETAGRYVAGRKVFAGDVLRLSDEQAKYEVIKGFLKPATAAKAAAAARRDTKDEKADD